MTLKGVRSLGEAGRNLGRLETDLTMAVSDPNLDGL